MLEDSRDPGCSETTFRSTHWVLFHGLFFTGAMFKFFRGTLDALLQCETTSDEDDDFSTQVASAGELVGGIFSPSEVPSKSTDDVRRAHSDGSFSKDASFSGLENLRVRLDLTEEGSEPGVELVTTVTFLWDALLFKFPFKDALLRIGLQVEVTAWSWLASEGRASQGVLPWGDGHGSDTSL